MEYVKTLRDSIRYLYDNPAVTYTQLLVAAGKAEANVGNGKSGTVTVKAKAVTVNDELVSLKQQVSDLVAVVKANQLQGKSKGATTQQNSSNNRNQAKDLRYRGVMVNSPVLLDHPTTIKYHTNAITVGDGATW